MYPPDIVNPNRGKTNWASFDLIIPQGLRFSQIAHWQYVIAWHMQSSSPIRYHSRESEMIGKVSDSLLLGP